MAMQEDEERNKSYLSTLAQRVGGSPIGKAAQAAGRGFEATGYGLGMALDPRQVFGRLFNSQDRKQVPAPGARPTPTNFNAYRIPSDGTKQLQMLEQQTQGFDTAADRVSAQDRGFEAPQAPSGPELTLDAGRFGGDRDVFVNTAPPEGFGQAIYSDSRAGAQPGAFGGRGNIVDPGGGPFGRTQEQQRKIAERVGQYQSAIDLMRSMRGVPTERDRLQRRAGQQISLDQGLGGFVNQAADRNYARDQIKELDALSRSALESSNDRDRLAFDMQQAGIENAMEAERVNQGRYKLQSVTTGYDPLGREIEGVRLLDTRTGAVTDPSQGLQPQMTEAEIRKAVEAEADEASGGLTNLFTSEKDIFNGKSKEQWIKDEIQSRLSAQGGQRDMTPQPRGQATAVNPDTGERMIYDPSKQEWVKA